MTWYNKLLRYLWSTVWYTFAAFVVLWAITFGVIRLLLPFADYYKSDASEYVSQYLGQTLTVESVAAEWHGWGPSVVFNDVAVMDAKGEKRILQFDKIRLGFDTLQSLAQWELVFSRITLVGAKLVITRDVNRQIFLAGFAGSQDTGNGDVAPEVLDRFTEWFFSQGEISLEDSDITWHDEFGAGRELAFSSVNMTLRNSSERHVLDASITLPRVLGSSLRLQVDMRGNPRDSQGRDTRIYVAGDKVKLLELFDTQMVAGVNVDVGDADFRIWSHWAGGELQMVQGDVSGRGLLLTEQTAIATSTAGDEVRKDPAQVKLDSLTGKFRWQHETEGWQFEADDLRMARAGREWQPSRVSISFNRQDTRDPVLNAAVSYLQLEDVAQVVSLFKVGGEKVHKLISDLQPQGKIFDAQLVWSLSDTPEYKVYARLQDANINAWASVPEAKNVNGRLWLNRQGGHVELEQAAVILDFPKLFRGAIPIDTLRGRLSWQMQEGGWRLLGRDLIAENRDISTRAILDVIKDKDADSPFMSLIADFENGDGSQVARYLPAGIMPERTVNWLDNGIVKARLVSGGAIFNGRLRGFPFDKGDGRFEVRFQVEDSLLRYANDWPVIEDISAEVQFLGRGMTVNARRGRIFSNDIQWATVHIADMTHKPFSIQINGDVQGTTQDKLDYLAASPQLWEKFGKYLQNMKTLGESQLHLDIDLKIGKANANEVNGWLSMQKNEITLEPMGAIVTDLNGKLMFSQNELQADDISAKLFGQESSVTVSTDQGLENRNIRIRASGQFSASDMMTRYLPVMSDEVSGMSPWDVSMVIPLEQGNAAPHVATFRVVSDLQGVEIRLPEPLAKQPADVKNLVLRVDFYKQRQPVMQISYNNVLDAWFELGEKGFEDLLRGEMRINSGTATLPKEPGIRVLGKLDKFVLDDWQQLWRSDGENNGRQVSRNAAAFPHPLFVDLTANVFAAFGQQLHGFGMQAQSDENGLLADVQSEEMVGQIKVPFDLSEKPIEAVLSHWTLAAPELSKGRLDPRNIPALNFRVEDFRFKDKHFGALRFETTRLADGLRIEQLVVNPRSTAITLRGGWFIDAKGHRSNVHLNLSSSNIGRTLTSLGYVGGIEDGKGTVEAELEWADSIANVNAANLNGQVKMVLEDGQLLDVDPGAGRIFSLLSVQTLPRRLSLDFSDIFKKGFGFDRIDGTFNIADGNAYTNDLFMDGPAARIDIAGRIGLVAEDYDQLVTITPHLSGTLPVLGALAATPQIGAAILFAQKLLKLEIGEATRNQYSITGEWKNPVIKKLKKAKINGTEE